MKPSEKLTYLCEFSHSRTPYLYFVTIQHPRGMMRKCQEAGCELDGEINLHILLVHDWNFYRLRTEKGSKTNFISPVLTIHIHVQNVPKMVCR